MATKESRVIDNDFIPINFMSREIDALYRAIGKVRENSVKGADIFNLMYLLH